MGDIKVNISGVLNAATEINNINERLRDQFYNVQDAIGELGRSWESPAADVFRESFNTTLLTTKKSDGLVTARYKLVDNYVRILRKTVGIGYETVEDANIKLADAFKK